MGNSLKALFEILISRWGLAAFVIWFAITAFSYRSQTQDTQAWNYILSSISQGLAALLAIVLSVTFVVTQISHQSGIHSSKSILLPPETMFLTVFYCFGITAPLLAMQEPSECEVDFCISLATACVAILIPYLAGYGQGIGSKSATP